MFKSIYFILHLEWYMRYGAFYFSFIICFTYAIELCIVLDYSISKKNRKLDLIPFILCLIRKYKCYKIYTILASAWLHFLCILFLHFAFLPPIFQLFCVLMILIFRWIFAYWISWLHRQDRRCPWLPNRQARSRQIDVMLFGRGGKKQTRSLFTEDDEKESASWGCLRRDSPPYRFQVYL